ncbi:MAG TPA: malto-oligosyltrehalose trehalohydrolase [Verrucomicrobiae bacterium]|nr:malto-oligosyltrehalose trehalohydrolase [Verrucomicrobiae bacterium]
MGERGDGVRLPVHRRLPVGAEVRPGGGVHFRVWAPKSQFVAVKFGNDQPELEATSVELEAEGTGYFSGLIEEAAAGMLYKIQLDSGVFPDPASRFQPEGPHGASQVIDPGLFHWTDSAWKGRGREGHVIYELHIGTFSPDGTLAGALGELQELAGLGITTVELMPVAEFPGRFGWGYDGVGLFAPTHLYGEPDDLRRFVNRAHELGLSVILDVVYNHLGPDGNYLKEFSNDYFTDRYANEWGEPLNFDGPDSGPVREFFIANAGYWIDEFHFDGLRLDATQQIFDSSEDHVIAALARRVREAAPHRATFIVAENESQDAWMALSQDKGGHGVDALWNDDFHHAARIALTGRKEAYYSDYSGTPQEFISTAKHGYLYQGQWYSWQKKNRGASARGLHPNQFVTFIENHDQVANSLRGMRVHQLTSPGKLRAMTALLLLGPGTPMLFQGQEFAASAPFLYFADHNPELARCVAEGRKKFVEQFPSVASAESTAFLTDPQAEETFARCRLDLSERERNAPVYTLHRDLLRLRREDPVLSLPRAGGVDGAVIGSEAFLLRFFGEGGADRLLLVNFGRDLQLPSLSDPLVAPPAEGEWHLMWSSENPKYGGSGTPSLQTENGWCIPGQAAVLLGPRKDVAHDT